MLKKGWKVKIFFMLMIFFAALYGGVFSTESGSNIMLSSAFAADKDQSSKVIEAAIGYLEPGKKGRPMVIDLGATSCIPCKMMVPILDDLAKEYSGKVDIQFVDVNKRGDLAEKHKIYAIPTQIFFDGKGKEFFRHEGFFPKEEIIKKLKEMGVK
jgi:thioredoxin 1